ncbi:MAG: hypothetical protein KKC75_02465 [Nanoarchaeota archaeon]|nr:hypothetical protein [Nanoarchaeota archaeon]MBU1004665.1 hypothetical protein [Nanoarchaeota archaeon]MBU1945729.1 hypothetical protein [Nanoarchaeota archaeon]
MKKTNYILGVIMVLFLIPVVKAEVPQQNPFYSVGSDFLVIKYHPIEPEIHVLFDDTSIYLDNQNDGTWDYEFSGNAGETITLDPVGSAVAEPGGLIHSNKPVGYKQELQNTGSYISRLYTFVPVIDNLKSEYFTYGSHESFFSEYSAGRYDGKWYVVAPKETTIYVDQNITGNVSQAFNVSPGELKAFSADPYSRVYSNKPFLVFNRFTIGGIKSRDFYTPWDHVQILVIENATEIKVDINNDGVSDEAYNLSKGLRGYSLAYGARITSNKDIAMFSRYETYEGLVKACGGNMDFCLFVVYAAVNTFPCNIGSDMWGDGGSYYDTHIYYVTGIYNQFSGLYPNTSYFVDNQQENDLLPEYNRTIASNTIDALSGIGKVHIWSDMPLLYSYKYDMDSSATTLRYLMSYPYSQIYSTSWPSNKIMGTNELTQMNVRVFNPFATTTINDLEIKIKVPDEFTANPSTSFLIRKQSLVNDNNISSDIISEDPQHIGDYYEFTLTNSDSSVIGTLSPLEYLNIYYNVITPASYGTYDFPTEITYTAPTWQK